MIARMGRREFISLIGGATAAWPVASAQQSEWMRRVGVLHTVEGRTRLAHFRRGLRDRGYIEERTIALEIRSAAGRYDRLDALAAELVGLKVDALLAVTLPAALAAQRATNDIPIVFVLVAEPVEAGLVASISRPGGNISGVAVAFQQTTAKRFELFKEAVGFSRAALLVNPSERAVTRRTAEVSEAAGAALGVSVQRFEARTSDDLPRAFAEMSGAEFGAALVAADAMFWQERERIAELALRSRIASMFALREHVDAGGLMSYGPSYDTPFYQAAAYVDRILKGEKPGDLPVEQPTKFDLLINLKTASTLGVNLPPKLLAIADEVIE